MKGISTAAAGLAAAIFSLGAGSAQAAESDREYCERQEGPAKVACMRDLNQPGTRPAAPASPAAAVTRPDMPAGMTGAASGAAGAAAYQVVDGFHVDPQTLKGFQTWRAAACDRCHGANQEGLVGPSLVNSLKVLSKADFVATVTHGRLEKGMPSFGADANVTNNLNQLYSYLKGRSDGAITKAHVMPIE